MVPAEGDDSSRFETRVASNSRSAYTYLNIEYLGKTLSIKRRSKPCLGLILRYDLNKLVGAFRHQAYQLVFLTTVFNTA